jgi:hypothetical protein
MPPNWLLQQSGPQLFELSLNTASRLVCINHHGLLPSKSNQPTGGIVIVILDNASHCTALAFHFPGHNTTHGSAAAVAVTPTSSAKTLMLEGLQLFNHDTQLKPM